MAATGSQSCCAKLVPTKGSERHALLGWQMQFSVPQNATERCCLAVVIFGDGYRASRVRRKSRLATDHHRRTGRRGVRVRRCLAA